MCTYSMIMDHGLQRPVEWIQYPQQVLDFQDLLRRAKLYDEEHDQKDCELSDKKEALQKIADGLGVEITFP